MKNEEKEQKQAIVILIIVFIILLLALIWTFKGKIRDFVEKENMTANLGQIQAQENTLSDYVDYTPSKELIEADNLYYETHGDMIAIIDEKSLLSSPGFLSIQLHMTKTEIITEYLNKNGYGDCSYVTVVDDSILIDGSKSEFQLIINDYPGIYLNVKAYNLTNTMELSFSKDSSK